MAHGIGVEADALFEEMEFEGMDMLVLPGGMPGTKHLKEHRGLCVLLQRILCKRALSGSNLCSAYCIWRTGISGRQKACCYPGMESGLSHAETNEEPVNVDGHMITSRGLGTAIPFALKLIESSCAERKKAEEIGHGVVYY